MANTKETAEYVEVGSSGTGAIRETAEYIEVGSSFEDPHIRVTQDYIEIGSSLPDPTPDLPALAVDIDVTNDPSDPVRVWTAFGDRMAEVTIRRGRQQELGESEAGTVNATSDNRDRVLDPTHVGSPYWPNIVPMRPIRVQATKDGITYPLASAYIENIPPRWDGPNKATAVIDATDAFLIFAGTELPDSVFELEAHALAPTHWWRLGETSGAFADVIGSAHGTEVGGVTRRSTPLHGSSEDGSVSFDGEQGQVAIPETGSATAYPMSIFGIFQYTGGDAGTFGFFSRTIYSTWRGDINVYVDSGSLGTQKLNALFTVGGVANIAESTVSVTDGRRHDFVIVFRADGTVRIYIDGEDATDQTVGPNVPAAAPSAERAAFGSLTSDPPSQVWKGLFDEPMIWSGHEVTATEAARLHDARIKRWSGDTTGVRLDRILDYLGVDATLRDVDAGNSKLGPATLGGDALTYMRALEATEDGLLFVKGDGVLRFIERHARLRPPYTTSVATFGDGPGELPYLADGLEPDYSRSSIRNIVRVDRADGGQQTAVDQASVDRYLRSEVPRSGMFLTDQDTLGMAYWLLAGDPTLKIRGVVLNPKANAYLWQHVLGRELGDRVTARKRPPGGGALLEQQGYIAGIVHNIGPWGKWLTTFWLAPVRPQTYMSWAADAASATADQHWSDGTIRRWAF